jgi:hypothetical protein
LSPKAPAVVFIHDRDYPARKQLGQRVLQVAVTNRRSEIVAREQKLRYHLLAEKQPLVGVHELALTNRRACLQARDVARPLVQSEVRHARGDRAGSDDQVFVLAEIELIHHGAQQVRVNLSARKDQTGTDFDDDSHAMETFLSSNGIALCTEVAGACGTGSPAGRDNTPILQLKWLSGKMKKFATF